MNNNADWLEGFDAGLAANAERAKELEAGLEIANSRWIPTSERLPDENGAVLVTTPDSTVRLVYFWAEGRFDFKGRDAIAWQPLPEPYKPE